MDLDVQGQLLADCPPRGASTRLTWWHTTSVARSRCELTGCTAVQSHRCSWWTSSPLRPWGSPFFNLVKDHPDVFARLPEAVHPGALRAYIAGASHRGLTEVQLDELAAPWLTEQGRPAFHRQVAQADERFTDDCAGRLHGIRAPVRIVWGEDDTWIPVARARSLRDAIPGSTLRLVSAAGHLVHLDAPIASADESRAWPDQQGDRTGTHR